MGETVTAVATSDPPRRADAAMMRHVTRALERHGVLLSHDKALPCVSALVVGEPVSGSWWSHPLCHAIYDAEQRLDDIATRVKLVNAKVTFVHPRLFPALVAVGASRAAWQTAGLTATHQQALARVNRARRPLRADELGLPSDVRPGDIVRDLEARLLVHAEGVHTDAGHHVKVAQSWRRFAVAQGIDELPSIAAAEAAIEDAVRSWRTSVRTRLPWR